MKPKNYFTLQTDYWNFFRLLTNEELGGLLRGIYEYEKDSVLPENISERAMIAFEMVRTNLDKERAEYEKVCMRNRRIAENRWQKEKTRQSASST